MYLDITYPRLLRTNFWAQTLLWTQASTYVRPLSLQPRSLLQSITCQQAAWHFNAVGMSPCVKTGGVLIASSCCKCGPDFPYSGSSREPAPTSLHSSYVQSRKQSAASIILFDFERRYSWWHDRVQLLTILDRMIH